jgi:phosphate:Na+ symporter
VRRIAIAHVLFNTITGILALLFFQQLGNIARWVGDYLGNDSVLTLALFHTLFNVVGIFLFFPWLDGFARLIEKLTGRHDISCVSRLGKTLSNAGDTVALEAAWRAMVELSVTSLHAIKDQDKRQAEAIQDLQSDIQKVSDFIHSLHFDAADSHSLSDRRERLWHALDHLRRLSHDLAKPAKNVSNARAKESITQAQHSLNAWLNWANRATPTDGETSVAELAKASSQLAATRKDLRIEMFDQLGSGELQPADAMNDLDSLRWYDGAYYHAWRLADSLWKAAGIGSAEGL